MNFVNNCGATHKPKGKRVNSNVFPENSNLKNFLYDS